MNLNKKIILSSIAGVLALSPIVPAALNPVSTVEAAGVATLKLNHNSYVYTAQGQRTYYNGKKTLKMGTKVSGTSKITTIKGKNYYPLTGGAYIKAANVGTINSEVQPGNLELNYNSFVYDKNGRRLPKFRGSKKNTHLRKGTPVKYSGTVEKTERNSKQYFLLDDDNYNQSWLPYEKIGGKYYYNVGGGGYINAANVGQIDNKPLYTAEATVTLAKRNNFTKSIQIGYGREQRAVKIGQKVKVDRVAVRQYDPSNVACFRISGSQTGFFAKSLVQKQPRQKLLTFTKNTYILVTSDTNTYDINGEVRTSSFLSSNKKTPFTKGDKIPVDEALYLWSNKDNRAELYYHLARNNSITNRIFVENNKDNMTFIKATAGQYISGPRLIPTNTAEEAKADAKVADKTDKTELQKQIDQEKIVKAEANYKQFSQPRYDAALALAKKVNASPTASIAEVKQTTQLLKEQQKLALLSAEESLIYDTIESTMPE